MSEEKFAAWILEEIGMTLQGIKQEEAKALVEALRMDRRIFCDGSGRSRLAAEGFAMRLMQMGFTASVVGEATAPAIRAGDMLIIFSGSGRTGVLVEHSRRAREAGALVAAVTTDAESDLAMNSHMQIIIRAPRKDRPEAISIQPMGSLYEQSVGILCDIMVLMLMERFGISSEDMYCNHSNLE